MIQNEQKFKMIYTISVFMILSALNNAVIGLFPPLFSSIAEDLNAHISSLGLVSSINLFVTSASSVLWAYLADKGKRKKLIITGSLIWAVSVFLTAYSKNYIQLAMFQVLTGIGLGCVGSIGFSILTDSIPKQYRGMLMSFWGGAQGFGITSGGMMASLISASYGWRVPFIVLAALGSVLIVLYFFIKEPEKGAAEPELKALTSKGYGYDYTIELSQIHDIVTKKSNIWLIWQGFFVNISAGTLIWLPTLYISKITALGYSSSTAIIASGYLYSLLQAGGSMSAYFGYLGDRAQKRNLRGRAFLTSLLTFAAFPLYVSMIIIPIKKLSMPDSGHPTSILSGLFVDLITNPQMILMLILALAASAVQSANSPNWLAMITDVNLPEHRATAFSIANLVSGIGRSLGNGLMGLILKIIPESIPEPTNYVIALSLFQVFLLPAGSCYLALCKTSKKDILSARSLMRKRAIKK